LESLLLIFKNKNFSRLFLANFTSQMGSVIGVTAFMFFILHRFSHQPSYATITELMYSLPTLAVFFLVGVVADRMNRKQIAANCDFICSVLSILLLFCVYKNIMILTFTLLFLRSAVSKFFQPAQQGIMQGILKEDEYTASAGLNQMVSSLFNLFGSGLGIAIYWTLGLEGAIMIDAISFLISGLLIRTCKVPEIVNLPNGNHSWRDLNLKFVYSDFKDSLIYILKNKLLISLILGFILFGVVNGGLSVLPAFILKYKLAPHSYETFSIWNSMAFGVGLLIGSLFSPIIAKKLELYQAIVLGLILGGITIICSGFVTNPFLFIGMSGLTGLTLPLINIGIGGWFPKIVDPKMMGRVLGWISPLMMLSHSITLGTIAFIYPSYVNIEWIFALVGGCLAVVGIFYWIVLPNYYYQNNVVEVTV